MSGETESDPSGKEHEFWHVENSLETLSKQVQGTLLKGPENDYQGDSSTSAPFWVVRG